MPNTAAEVVVDSGPLIALFDLDDPYHERAIEFVRASTDTLISSMAVVTEVAFLLRKDLRARKNLFAFICTGGLSLMEPEMDDFQRISELIEKYADLPMDFTDAVVVSVCERLGTNRVATIDRDFSIYRYKGRGKFINVFLD